MEHNSPAAATRNRNPKPQPTRLHRVVATQTVAPGVASQPIRLVGRIAFPDIRARSRLPRS